MSQINYARRLVNGIGTAKNEVEGFRWYQKAAETGNSYAQNGVGTCYEFGYGIDQNFGEAKRWYQKPFAKTDFP
jgi:TPR repeat protein